LVSSVLKWKRWILTFESILQLALDNVCAPLRSHDSLPLLHLGVGKEATVECRLEPFLLQLLADEYNLLSAVSPWFLKIVENALSSVVAFWPFSCVSRVVNKYPISTEV